MTPEYKKQYGLSRKLGFMFNMHFGCIHKLQLHPFAVLSLCMWSSDVFHKAKGNRERFLMYAVMMLWWHPTGTHSSLLLAVIIQKRVSAIPSILSWQHESAQQKLLWIDRLCLLPYFAGKLLPKSSCRTMSLCILLCMICSWEIQPMSLTLGRPYRTDTKLPGEYGIVIDSGKHTHATKSSQFLTTHA